MVGDWIERLLGGLGLPAGEAEPTADEALALAAALLLIEVGRADFQWDQRELDAIVRALVAGHDLSPAEAEALLARAREQSEATVSLHPTLRLLNAQLDTAARRRILLDCWRVALADGVLDRYEEHELRKIADRLHLSHADFIQAKLRAQRERAAEE